MLRISLFLVLSGLLSACATSGPVQLSPDTYMISKTDKGGIFGNPSKMKLAVIREANEFAASQGKTAIPLSTTETPLVVGQRFASIEYQFRVVSSDDPEYQRTALEKRADIVIKDDKNIDINVTTEDKEAPDVYDSLIRLEDLRAKGILTGQEFEREKQRILSRAN